ncbi:MAG: hypothetical protein AAF985_21340 [Bacteroidota bacterium]
MQRIKQIAFILLSLAALFFLFLVLRPLPRANPDHCSLVEGIVERIYEAGTQDIVFKLQGNTVNYYINRGLEHGLDLALLRQSLADQEVSIYYLKHWTPLDPNDQVKHIARLELGQEVIYDEMEESTPQR